MGEGRSSSLAYGTWGILERSTATLTVTCVKFLFCTVERELGRQFRTCFMGLRLPRQQKMTVQKPKGGFHTVVSKDDFLELTVEKGKSS